jgi:phage-related protein
MSWSQHPKKFRLSFTAPEWELSRCVIGSSPCRANDRKIIGADIQTVEFGWPIGMPLCRSLGGGLWEVRSKIMDGIARVIFFLHEGKLVILNGFIKKTQKTPDAEIELAQKRKKEEEAWATKISVPLSTIS